MYFTWWDGWQGAQGIYIRAAVRGLKGLRPSCHCGQDGRHSNRLRATLGLKPTWLLAMMKAAPLVKPVITAWDRKRI
jgi:hypothetical protein